MSNRFNDDFNQFINGKSEGLLKYKRWENMMNVKISVLPDPVKKPFLVHSLETGEYILFLDEETILDRIRTLEVVCRVLENVEKREGMEGDLIY